MELNLKIHFKLPSAYKKRLNKERWKEEASIFKRKAWRVLWKSMLLKTSKNLRWNVKIGAKIKL